MENGNKVYNSLDEYQDSADDTLAFTAAATLAEMIYAIDAEFEKALPTRTLSSKLLALSMKIWSM
ncbi:MAG: hypothetical protein CM15mV24_2370 [Bellamyvirus sp.]|nr:MAG: hypothetical protein CM15mV24_2370 [Bellamyvirus sp.]